MIPDRPPPLAPGAAPAARLEAFLLALARAAGAGLRWRLVRTFPYRMTLVGARIDGRPSGETSAS